MAGTDNKIGDFSFIALRGDPDQLREDLRLVARPGVDGVAVWKTGRRGEPFQLLSQVDAQSVTHARFLALAYQELVDSNPVQVIWAGVPLVAEQVVFKVLRVRPLNIRAMKTGVGGLNPPSLAIVEAVWDLVPVWFEVTS